MIQYIVLEVFLANVKSMKMILSMSKYNKKKRTCTLFTFMM